MFLKNSDIAFKAWAMFRFATRVCHRKCPHLGLHIWEFPKISGPEAL